LRPLYMIVATPDPIIRARSHVGSFLAFTPK